MEERLAVISVTAAFGIAGRPGGLLPGRITVADATVFKGGRTWLRRSEIRATDTWRDGLGALTTVGIGTAHGAVIGNVDRAARVTGGRQKRRRVRGVIISLRQPGGQ